MVDWKTRAKQLADKTREATEGRKARPKPVKPKKAEVAIDLTDPDDPKFRLDLEDEATTDNWEGDGETKGFDEVISGLKGVVSCQLVNRYTIEVGLARAFRNESKVKQVVRAALTGIGYKQKGGFRVDRPERG